MPAATSTPPPLLALPPHRTATGEWPDMPLAAWRIASAVRAAPASPWVVLAADEAMAQRLEVEIRFYLSGVVPVARFHDVETLPYDPFSPHQEVLSERLATLARLPQVTDGVWVVGADSLLRRLPPLGWLSARGFSLQRGQKLDFESFRERLVAAGYQSVSEVQTQGEFAIRGALMDLFPMGSPTAYRLDLFDDELETLRTFDPETQRSLAKVDGISLLPAREFPTDRDGIETFRRQWRATFHGDPTRSRVYTDTSQGYPPAGIEAYLPLFFTEPTAHLLDYLPKAARVVMTGDLAARLESDWEQLERRFERYDGNLERPLLKPDAAFLGPAETASRLAKHPHLLSVRGAIDPARLATPDADSLKKDAIAAPRALFVAESPGRREAVAAWLKPQGLQARLYERFLDWEKDKTKLGLIVGPVQDSLVLGDGSLVVAEPQLFGLSAPAARTRRAARARDPETVLKDLSSLGLGSPVVHVAHGVGRYRGLERITAAGIEAEYLVLEYAKGDKVFVPVASLSMIHRFTGADGETAPLHTLGTERWGKAQQKAREKANDVAAELLHIQARRGAKVGQALAWDAADYARFVVSFPFETTPDQQTAIDAVLADLESEKPMDRVVCGDVGFGKTEVAMRAAFAAARAGKQVCILAPTTLLASQHEKNFQDRFADWPLRVGGLSRLKSTKEQTALLAELADGRLDIVIGTHRLLQADTRFKDLGLVIVDEEHRFGVRHKEALKNLRADVNLLTLTATPIPRTLNMSLSGLRDLSVIATPPPGRLPIKTVVTEWERGLVQEACLRELKRGGQIYVLHNDVADIDRFSRELQNMVPEGRVRYAHGQMREKELEQVMLDFYHARFNILVSTTIIESGIDVPTANTILIDRADQLGLAQLHQLRGRVGRSHHRAYAYLLVPSRRALSQDATQRLEAIEAMGELGSGFTLATHDLEIRGAGELLGENQAGQIEEVGFTMYAEMLARAVKAIQRGKLDDSPLGRPPCEVDLGASALIPDDYVADVHHRLVFYKRISEAGEEQTLHELRVEMIDRFGFFPPPLERLFDAASLRVKAQPLGVTKLRVGETGGSFEFGAQASPDSGFDPQRLIALVQRRPKTTKLEGGGAKLSVTWARAPEDMPAADALAKRRAAVEEVLDILTGTVPLPAGNTTPATAAPAPSAAPAMAPRPGMAKPGVAGRAPPPAPTPPRAAPPARPVSPLSGGGFGRRNVRPDGYPKTFR